MRPFPLGGADVNSNVQVVCHVCHQLKTRTEFGGARDVAQRVARPRRRGR
ncbi:hypothetical protein ACWFQ8_16025 [Streptomyces sp. NPDC055254]